MKKLILIITLMFTPFMVNAFPYVNKIDNEYQDGFYSSKNELKFHMEQIRGKLYYVTQIKKLGCHLCIEVKDDLINSRCVIAETEKKEDNFNIDGEENGPFYTVSMSTIQLFDDNEVYAFYFKGGFVTFDLHTKKGDIGISKNYVNL